MEYLDIVPTICNLDARFRVMDRYPDVLQMLTVAAHIPSDVAEPAEALELSMRLNDEMAELVQKHPDRFAGAVAGVDPAKDIEVVRDCRSSPLRAEPQDHHQCLPPYPVDRQLPESGGRQPGAYAEGRRQVEETNLRGVGRRLVRR